MCVGPPVLGGLERAANARAARGGAVSGLPNEPPEVGDVTLEDLVLTVNSAYVVGFVGVFTDPDGDT